MNALIKRISTNPTVRTRKIVEMVEGASILDIGCGIGNITALVADKVSQNGRVIGIDFLQDNIDLANERFKRQNVEFRVGTVENLKFNPASFDCVLFLEVIEHVENPVVVLKSIHRLLKPNGCLIVSTPNGASFDTFFQNLKSFKKTITSIETETHGSGTERDHIYVWSLPQLYRLLNRCGFVYVKHEFAGAGFPFTNIDRLLGTNFSDFFSPLYGRFGMGLIIKVRKI